MTPDRPPLALPPRDGPAPPGWALCDLLDRVEAAQLPRTG